MYDPTPTGKTRFRVQHIPSGFVGTKQVLVLQLEMEYPEGPPDWNGMPRYRAQTVWEDAGVEHLSIKLNI